jgi:hypothetical protein
VSTVARFVWVLALRMARFINCSSISMLVRTGEYPYVYDITVLGVLDFLLEALNALASLA